MARVKKKEKILMPEEKLQEALVPESEWPYKLPENWCWVKHNAILDISGGAQPSKSLFSSEQRVGYTRLFQTRDYGDHPVPVYIPDKYATKTTSEGDILLARYGGSLGKVFWAHDGAYNVALAKVIKLYPDILDDRYLYQYYLSFFYQDFCTNASSGRSAQAGFNRNDMEELILPLPPLLEQQRIVNRIESLFAKLDEAKDKAQAVVDGFEDRKAAILHKAFTGELTCCKSDIHTVYITDVIKNEKNALKAGPFGSALRKDMYVSSGYKIYGQEQVINGDESIGDYYIDEKKYKELIACKVAPGDVLISLVGTVGKVLVLSKDCKPGIINPRLIKVSLDEDIMLPLYFKYYFESGYLKSLYKSDAHGTTMDVLNMGILKKLPFPLVGIDKQKEIIMTLNILLNNEEQAIESAEQVIAQIDTMKKSILARAFRGELGTNDPSDESAEELLKRIL